MKRPDEGHSQPPKKKRPQTWWVKPYLEALGRIGLKMATAKVVDVPYETVRSYRAKHPEFKEKEEEARQLAIDLSEMALKQHGQVGVEEPVIYKGKDTGIRIKKRSTTAMIAFLNANSDKYNRNKFGGGGSTDDHPEPDLRYI